MLNTLVGNTLFRYDSFITKIPIVAICFMLVYMYLFLIFTAINTSTSTEY